MAAVGRLAAGIAHEIRNPLASISGSISVLSRVSPFNDDQKTLLNIVTRESERLNLIISDFLVYSREKTYKFSRVNLISLLEDTLILLQNRSQCAGLKIVKDFSVPEAWATVDSDKIKQVFWNLLENAVRAVAGEGTITASVRAESDKWSIEIRDTGPGIPPQQIEKIFEPFQSQFEGGTGLGLAIVYQIIQAHGAKISVNSKPGYGAEFVLEIPGTARTEEIEASVTTAAGVSHG